MNKINWKKLVLGYDPAESTDAEASSAPEDLARHGGASAPQESGAGSQVGDTGEKTPEGSPHFDARGFARWVIILGVLLFGFGGARYVMNRPLEQSMRSLSDYLSISDENLYRGVRRENAVKFLIGGAIVLFVGVGFHASTRRARLPTPDHDS